MLVALVTGGTRGIGAKISTELKNKGYKVIANYHKDHENALKFSQRNNIEVIPWDVSDHTQSMHKIHDIQIKHEKIDILVHNAGITRDIFFHKMHLDQWNSVIKTNLDSCFYVTKPLIEGMRNRGFGRIIYISSVNGQKGQIGQTNYSAAKAGVIGFTKALAMENASKGITVNAIAPGYIETDMLNNMPQEIINNIVNQIPKKRLGKPEEIAAIINFLTDDKAQYITGSVLNINGGFYM